MYDEILRELSIEYERKRDNNVREQEIRKREAYERVPAIEKIDEKIFETGLSMTKNILGNPQSYESNLKKAQDQMEKLRMEKAYLMTESNIPLDYLEIRYDCKICEDTGYVDSGAQCSCLKQALVSRAYEMSNIEGMLERENFNTFDINVFSDQPFPGEPLSPRENMSEIAGTAQNFCNNFELKNGENLLFYGTTGLGKTFLSSCIAKELIDKGNVVIYQTAFTILDIIEKYRFQRGDKKLNEYQYNLLLNADLLIIDDLGTEVSNAFTNAEIFNIVNARIISNRKTIISTNLTPKEISEIYTDRVFSRVLDKFRTIKFYGNDLRWE